MNSQGNIWPTHDYGAYEIIMMLHELHNRGYEQLRLLPGLSPSGCAWRWFIYPKVLMGNSSSFEQYGDCTPFKSIRGSTCSKKVGCNIITIANTFEYQHSDIISLSKCQDSSYVEWFDTIIQHADHDIFPIAFCDYSDHMWSFTSGEAISYPPFTPESPFNLSDQDLITFAFLSFDNDSLRELQFVIDYSGKKPASHTIANTIKKAIVENKRLVSRVASAYDKALNYPDIKEKREIANGLEILTSDNTKIVLEDEVELFVW